MLLEVLKTPIAVTPNWARVLIDPGEVRRRTARAERIILAGAAVLTMLHCLYFFNQACDDGYISLAYARRWVQGRGLSLNDVAPSEGYSNFLWVALLAGAMKVGLDGLLFAKVLGVVCAAGVSMACARLVRASGGGLWAQSATGLFAATATPLAAWSCQGLETPLYVLEVVVLALTAGRLRRTSGRAVFVLTAGAMGLTRPEGLIVAAGLCVSLLILGRRRGRDWRRALILGLIVVAAVGLAHQIFRLSYFGQWLGNSTVHKWQPAEVKWLVGRGLIHLETLTGLYWSVPFLVVWSVLLLPLLRRRTRRRLVPTVLLLAQIVAFHVLVGGDVGPHFRFLVPALVLVGVVLSRAGAFTQPRSVASQALRLTGPAMTVVLAISGMVAMLRWVPLPSNFYACPSLSRPTAHAEAAEWLRRHAQPGDRVLLSEMGLIPYASDLPCFDYLGLCDRYMYGPQDELYPERYDQHRPRFVVLSFLVGSSGKAIPRLPSEHALLGQPGFLRTFQPAAEFTLHKTRSLMERIYCKSQPPVHKVKFVVFARRRTASGPSLTEQN